VDLRERAGVLAEQMTVQFRWASRLRPGLGVEVHDRHKPHIGSGREGPGIVWVSASVEEDQLARLRPYHRAVPIYRGYARGVYIVRDDEFTPGARRVVGAKEKAGQRIRVNVALESHRFTLLDIQDHTVPVIGSRQDAFRACFSGQLEEVASIESV
jgi:hypothetical protein